MALIVFFLGLFSMAAGVAMIGFGIPINEFGLGNTLINAGVLGVVGGLILFGLAATVRQLERITESLSARRLPRPARPADLPAAPAMPARNGPRLPVPSRPAPPDVTAERREPRQAPPPPPGFSSEAIERMRSNIPRIDRAPDSAPATEHEDETPLSPRAPVPPFPMPRPVSVDRTDAGEGEVRTESRPSFPWRNRTRPQPDAAAEQAEPSVAERERPVAHSEPARPPQQQAAAPEPAAGSEQPVAILKSGVVDGMAYTLYADGSIEAKLPEGTVRFASITELREHLEKNG